MSETGRLQIHAQIKPTDTNDKAPTAAKGPIHIQAKAGRPARRRRRPKPALTQGDRLLRNSAYACALLLGILALGNVNQPWARKASDSVERALTMRIDLDESIGALQFVKNLMPDTAQVFMNLSGKDTLARPVDGPLTHAWTALQPWLMFNCPEGSSVACADAGTVTAVSPMSGGLFGVLVDHGEGVETLYAHLAEAQVSPGDAVDRGQALGRSADAVYFEYRKGGESEDPAAAMDL